MAAFPTEARSVAQIVRPVSIGLSLEKNLSECPFWRILWGMNRTSVLAIALAAGVVGNACLAGGSYIEIGAFVTPYAANADGSVVAGYDSASYFIYTQEGGYQSIGGSPPADNVGGAPSLSSDGMRVGGTSLNPATNFTEMSVYDRATGTWTICGNLGANSGTSTSSGWGISRDGQTVVGLGWISAGTAYACYWRQGAGMTSLGSTVVGRSTRANGTNSNGSVIVGWQDNATGFRQGCVWTNGVQTLISGTGGALGEAGNCSADGTVVVGSGASSNSFQAWRWTAAGGAVNIGPPPVAGWRGSSVAVSDDGQTVVGFYRPFPAPATFGRAFIWTAADGMRDLTDLAVAQGISVPDGTILALPLAISGDGRTVVGQSRASTGAVNGFILRLEAPATPADLNGDGAVNGLDLSALLANWGGSGAGDIDGNGVVNGSDLTALLAAWTG
jgi:uncharacterized membrane protein